jgi:hypothetical protein
MSSAAAAQATEAMHIATNAATLPTEPMSSAAAATLQSEPMRRETDDVTVTTKLISSAAATTTLTNDKSIVGAVREQFYRNFGEVYSKIVEGSTKTITKKRYDEIVHNLWQCRAGDIKKP